MVIYANALTSTTTNKGECVKFNMLQTFQMATSKGQSLPGGIIKLTKFLEHLNKSPKLTFANNVRTLRVTLAYQNDHWGAR